MLTEGSTRQQGTDNMSEGLSARQSKFSLQPYTLTLYCITTVYYSLAICQYTDMDMDTVFTIYIQ